MGRLIKPLEELERRPSENLVLQVRDKGARHQEVDGLPEWLLRAAVPHIHSHLSAPLQPLAANMTPPLSLTICFIHTLSIGTCLTKALNPAAHQLLLAGHATSLRPAVNSMPFKLPCIRQAN